MAKLDEDNIVKAVASKLKDAVSFSNSNIANKQEAALKLYKRDLLDGDNTLKGRSKWVSPEAAQRIDWMTAQLIRIFDSPENVVEFHGIGPEDEAIAKQQNDVVNWILKTKNSHLSYLHPWIQNGLVTGLGVVTAEFETTTIESLPQLMKGVPEEQLVAFDEQEEQGLIVIEEVSKPYTNELGLQMRDLKIRNVRRVPSFTILSVAPEDFIVSKDAKFGSTGGIEAKLQGHRKIVGKAALIEMGFDAAKVEKIPLASDKTDGIALERTKDLHGEQVSGDDVEVYQVFTKLKLDRKTRDYRLTLAGSLDAPVLLDYEETSRFYPYAAFVPFPLADTLFGLGIPDKIGDDHTLITKMTRAMLDSLHMSVHPIRVVNPDQTNIDDLLNVHPGSVIRSSDPSGGISYNTPPFAGSAAMPVIQSLSQSLDFSTGVGPQMISLNASDMQDVTATAANQRSNASQLLIEMVSRIFADTGYSYLIRVIVDQLIQNPEDAQALVSRLTNGFVPLDQFNPELDVATSVGFGVMSRDQSTATLMNLLSLQMQAQPLGIVQAPQIYATAKKIAEVAGYRNTSAMFIDPATLPPAPPPPPPVDPNAGLIAVETSKAQLKAQSDEAQRQFEMQKFVFEMDFKRDQMAQDFALKQAEIEAKYRAQVDVERLKIEQQIQRDLSGAPMPPVPVATIQNAPISGPEMPPIMPPEMMGNTQ